MLSKRRLQGVVDAAMIGDVLLFATLLGMDYEKAAAIVAVSAIVAVAGFIIFHDRLARLWE